MDLKALTPWRLKLVIIGVPMLLATVYLTLIAADRYVSESVVALQQSSNPLPDIGGAALLLSGLGAPSREETMFLRDYMQSLGLLKSLDAELGLRKHFESEKLDLLARLWGSSSQERFLNYFRDRVTVTVDDVSSTLTVRVQGFDAAFAQRLNLAILKAGERFVNEMSHSLAREKLRFSEQEIARARDGLQRAKAEVLAFQSKNGFLNPLVQAQASSVLAAQLQASISTAQADLRGLRTFQTDDSFAVKALQAQIKAAQTQLELEKARATGSGDKQDHLGAMALEFEGLRMKSEFALDAYKVALLAEEGARMDSTRKVKSLVVIDPASLPETAEYPRRLYDLATVLVVCLLLYGAARLIIATIREHQD